MKKIATLFIAVLLLVACGQKQKKEIKAAPYSELLQYADSFIASHPNMLSNSILEEKARNEFRGYCMKHFAQDSISPTNGILVRLGEIEHVKESSEHEYKVYFEAENQKRKFSSNNTIYTYYCSASFFVLMPENIAITLVEGGYYYVYGRVFGNKPQSGGFGAFESPFVNKGKEIGFGTWWIDNPVITLVAK